MRLKSLIFPTFTQHHLKRNVIQRNAMINNNANQLQTYFYPLLCHGKQVIWTYFIFLFPYHVLLKSLW